MIPPIRTILLIDDDHEDQQIFREALTFVDDSILFLTQNNPVAALEMLYKTSHYPDLIFMDINMPMMNGIECLSAMKKSDKLQSIPVLMYSTSCTLFYKRLCIKIGAAGYIEKPNDFDLLCDILKHIANKGLDPSKQLFL